MVLCPVRRSPPVSPSVRLIPRRQRGFTLIEILVVLSILAALAAMVASSVGKAPAARNKMICTNNLRNLGSMITVRRLNGSFRARPGTSWLLQLRVDGDVLEGDEELFLCPNDPARGRLEEAGFRKGYDRIDLERPDPDQCSYSVRDQRRHPLAADSPRKEPLAACPWHQDGVPILYHDGSVVFRDRSWLGLSRDEPIVLGPGASHEALRVFEEAPVR